MTTADEMLGTAGQRAPDSVAVRSLSGQQDITLVTYRQQVLPLDGYVFWLRGGTQTIKGSLHYATDRRQNEDETVSVNRATLTTTEEVVAFNAIGPQVILVAEVMSGPPEVAVPLRIAFVRQAEFYKSAGLYHYSGEALYPALATQLIDSGAALPAATQIISNSLPAWLQMATYAPIWLRTGNPGIPLFPSFAVPQNQVPPYGAVHIEPSGTEALQATPMVTVASCAAGLTTGTMSQLMRDRVRVTLYGCDNDSGINFLALALQYMGDTNTLGLMNVPSLRDGKRRQAELAILAQQKIIDFDVSYQQQRIVDVTQQLILSAQVSLSTHP